MSSRETPMSLSISSRERLSSSVAVSIARCSRRRRSHSTMEPIARRGTFTSIDVLLRFHGELRATSLLPMRQHVCGKTHNNSCPSKNLASVVIADGFPGPVAKRNAAEPCRQKWGCSTCLLRAYRLTQVVVGIVAQRVFANTQRLVRIVSTLEFSWWKRIGRGGCAVDVKYALRSSGPLTLMAGHPL